MNDRNKRLLLAGAAIAAAVGVALFAGMATKSVADEKCSNCNGAVVSTYGF